MLTQLLPSSTVAFGVKLKIGFGTVASEMPGGTCQPATPPASGGVRAPLQYWPITAGFVARRSLLVPPLVSSETLVKTE